MLKYIFYQKNYTRYIKEISAKLILVCEIQGFGSNIKIWEVPRENKSQNGLEKNGKTHPSGCHSSLQSCLHQSALMRQEITHKLMEENRKPSHRSIHQ